nr:prepilin-type N-terminal cleavage/methylation domain-containing protein [Verrucomicrobiota bacterium]
MYAQSNYKRRWLTPMSLASPRSRTPLGFSLIELLTVIAIIGVLVAVGAFAFQGTGHSTAVSASAAQISTFLSGARQLAVSSNRKTRFIILTNSPANPEDWRLRRYAVMQEVSGTNSSKPIFGLVTPLEQLRPGVYFQRDRADATDRETSKTLFDAPDSMGIQNIAQAEYAFIEFLPTGATSTPSAENIFV